MQYFSASEVTTLWRYINQFIIIIIIIILIIMILDYLRIPHSRWTSTKW